MFAILFFFGIKFPFHLPIIHWQHTNKEAVYLLLLMIILNTWHVHYLKCKTWSKSFREKIKQRNSVYNIFCHTFWHAFSLHLISNIYMWHETFVKMSILSKWMNQKLVRRSNIFAIMWCTKWHPSHLQQHKTWK